MLRAMLKTADSRGASISMFRLAFLPLIAALASMTGGCAYGELKQVLRAQVASEISCADVTVERSSFAQPGFKPGQYHVKGCGVDRLYDCPKAEGLVSYGSKVCTYTDTSAVKAPAPPPPAAESMDAPMDDAPMDEPMAEPPAGDAAAGAVP